MGEIVTDLAHGSHQQFDALDQERENLKLSSAQSGRLGLLVSELKPSERERRGLKEKGVWRKEVDPKGPAARAGIRADDIFLSFNHQTVGSAEQLAELVRKASPGTPIAVLMMRDDGRRFLTLKIPQNAG